MADYYAKSLENSIRKIQSKSLYDEIDLIIWNGDDPEVDGKQVPTTDAFYDYIKKDLQNRTSDQSLVDRTMRAITVFYCSAMLMYDKVNTKYMRYDDCYPGMVLEYQVKTTNTVYAAAALLGDIDDSDCDIEIKYEIDFKDISDMPDKVLGLKSSKYCFCCETRIKDNDMRTGTTSLISCAEVIKDAIINQ